MLMAQMNPFDLPGPAFLALYLILLICGLVVAFLFRHWLVAAGEGQSPAAVELDAYEAAFLRGGSNAAIDTAIAMLVQRQALKANSATRSLTVCESLPRGAHPVEQAVYNAATPRSRPVQEVRAAARPRADQIADRLKMVGLIMPDDRWQMARTIPALIMATVLSLGVIKIFIGLSRNRPVGLLVILSFITAVAALIFFITCPRATPLGRRALTQLKLDNAALHTTARSRPQMLTPGDMAFAIGLFGVASLPYANTAWIELQQTLNPPVSSSSSGSSGCGSSSSCGSSCGGGGGCGGCGGG